MARAMPSRPLRIATQQGVVRNDTTVFDYGCGRGDDIRWLESEGIRSRGWDPAHRPSARKIRSDVVLLTYVINVVERPSERADILTAAWRLAKSVLAVSVRLDDERDEAHVTPVADGWKTGRGTFQKFFEHHEFVDWVAETLQVQPLVASPGMVYVFRSASERERFLAQRYQMPIPAPRTRKADEQFQTHRSLLQPLIDFFVSHGRLPKADELTCGVDLVDAFGSIARAFRVIEIVTDRAEWAAIADRRKIDLLVYLAMRTFDGDVRMSELPTTVQRDIRAHHQSLKAAQALADRLLFGLGRPEVIEFGCRSSLVGKLTPTALYVHIDAMSHAPALLRLYEACARRVAGSPDDTTLVKLFRRERKVSYLAYPDFDRVAHPAIASSEVIDLQALSYKRRSYVKNPNPPVLHRKETFLHLADERTDQFASLTEAEEQAGLLANTATIGTRAGWEESLFKAGYAIEGHTLVSLDRQ